MFRQLSTTLRATCSFRALHARDFARPFGHLSKQFNYRKSIQRISLLEPTCGYLAQQMHTVGPGRNKSEQELVDFLTEEIEAEKKIQKIGSIPAEIDGFKVKLEGADLELVKETKNAKIIVSFNVNHTVDVDEDAAIETNLEKSGSAKLKSKPNFEIDFVRDLKTLSFTCSFLPSNDVSGSRDDCILNDIFGINEVTMYEGTWNDKSYAVAGSVLDGYLYDLLMKFLEENGIGNQFVDKLSELATAYEHSSYIRLLEDISKFTQLPVNN